MSTKGSPRCSANLWCPCEDCAAYWVSLELGDAHGTDTQDTESEKELDQLYPELQWDDRDL